MSESNRRRWGALPARPHSRRRVLPWLSERLEDRALLTITNLTASASPIDLVRINPMNQPHAVQVAKIRPVTLAGTFTDTISTALPLPAVSYQVTDSYGRYEPAGEIATQPETYPTSTPAPTQLFFSQRIGLNLFRRPGSHVRTYTITLTARDSEGNSAVTSVTLSTRPRGFR